MNNYCLILSQKERLAAIKNCLGKFQNDFDFFDRFPENIADYKLVVAHFTDVNNEYLDKNISLIKENKIPAVFFSGDFDTELKVKNGIYRINNEIIVTHIYDLIKDFKEKNKLDLNILKADTSDPLILKKIEIGKTEHIAIKDNIYSKIISILQKRKESILFCDDDIPKDQKSVNNLKLADNIDSSLEIITSKQKFDIAVLDIEFINSDKDGFEILKELKKYNQSAKVIMLSGHDGFDAALRSFRMGADHFISKKNFNLEYFKDIVELVQMDGAPLIIGKSPVALDMFNKMSLYSKYTQDVLILGPNGTGKELIAKSIYHLSKKKGRFVTKNCAGIPHELFEAEMFGYVEGAFTGALKSGRKSPFEEAENGVLFLDEVGDMPIYQQSKMLRVLQERKIVRVGENTEKDVRKTRLIFATNKNLKDQIKNNEFREDFYYRITGAEVYSPALKDRKDDIELLTAYFVSKFIKDNQISDSVKIKITDQSFDNLKEYTFPGNIRELEKMVSQSLLNYLSNPKQKELQFEIPDTDSLLNEMKTAELEFFPVESIIGLIKKGAITTRGLSPVLKNQIINFLSRQGMNTKHIADVLGINEQSLRNMKAELKK